MLAKEDECYFTELYQLVSGNFPRIVNQFLLENNLKGYNFDKQELESLCGEALWDCLKTYDSSKGSLMNTLNRYAKFKMFKHTRQLLGKKRFNIEHAELTAEVALDKQLPVVEDFSLPEDVFDIVEQFVAEDVDGQVIYILYTAIDSKDRRTRLKEYFGKYSHAERKRVQRVRERLSEYLYHNGILYKQ